MQHKVMNSRVFLLAIFRALRYCRIAQASTYSGTSNAHLYRREQHVSKLLGLIGEFTQNFVANA